MALYSQELEKAEDFKTGQKKSLGLVCGNFSLNY